MTKARIMCATMAISSLAACAHHPVLWVKDGATSEDFARQKAHCEADVYRLPPMYNALPWQVASRNQSFFEQCMRAEGWTIKDE